MSQTINWPAHDRFSVHPSTVLGAVLHCGPLNLASGIGKFTVQYCTVLRGIVAILATSYQVRRCTRSGCRVPVSSHPQPLTGQY